MAEVLCYNRGCGKIFDPRDNPSESEACVHHPGAPFFHETYKGWSCCGKKTVDFTDFLNTPGCSRGPHSDAKPVEPESISGKKDERSLDEQMAAVARQRRPKEAADRLKRPDFSTTPIKRLQPTMAESLKALAGSNRGQQQVAQVLDLGDAVPEGEACKRGGCKARYGEPPASDDCVHHPGVPIFHEGMKFWSCCMKRTFDFTAFLNQAGCTTGEHKWRKDSEGSAVVECRYDWHQTATHVTVAVYGKAYDPATSFVEVGPVRLKVHLYFFDQGGAFDLDLELKGIVRVDDCSCLMAGTKVEVKMTKAEAGSWPELSVLKPQKQAVDAAAASPPALESKVEALDLDDIDFTPRKAVLSREASGGRSDADIK